MTHIEQAIKKAAAQGYRLNGLSKEALLLFAGSEMHQNVVLLDPLFWQALGKARGWHGEVTVMYSARTIDEAWGVDIWQYQWHRFIDHLAGVKDAESFFANLT